MIGNRMSEFLAFAHLLVRRLAVPVCLHQWSKNPKPLSGDHSRVGMGDLAVGRRKDNTMSPLAQSVPRHPSLGWIKVLVGDRNENVGHVKFSEERGQASTIPTLAQQRNDRETPLARLLLLALRRLLHSVPARREPALLNQCIGRMSYQYQAV